MSETPTQKQQGRAEEELMLVSRKFNTVFSGPAGQDVLDYIVKRLCRATRQLPISPAPPGAVLLPTPTSEGALYWGGRGDVGRAIVEIMEYEPQSAEIVVKRKRDGQ